MPPSKNIATYEDAYNALESALTHSEVYIDKETPGKARNFLMRLNSFKKLLRELEVKKSGTSFPTTKYDVLIYAIVPSQPSVIQIKYRPAETTNILGPDGKPVSAPENTLKEFINAETASDASQAAEPHIEDFAARFAKAQGLDPEG